MTVVSEDLLTDMLRPDVVYREGLAAGELRYQRCRTCEEAVFYPRICCPHCGGTDLVFAVSAGRGTVYSTTAIRRRDLPSYAVTMVDLAEGFRILSSVHDIPAEDVAIGMAVRIAFDTDADGRPRAVFTPEAAQ
ncbi:Zn-ribbon domain-containing OB-fold protein [Paractinoplanes globisporus]|uniref:Zn-ribbon domain-containing OB-fold protein n=1 Tax=Paractinoplanes globisporus TaxID=113565 RepID=A0ABW6W8E4_9ACTN|nr:OB-fold domain-containing protein [Actinoplanes globisporus]